MRNEEAQALDAALAVEARGMYARLLTDEEKRRIAALESPDALIALLRHSAAWGAAAAALPQTGCGGTRFSWAVERAAWENFARLRRFAEVSAREFLDFLAQKAELRALLGALRRLENPGEPAGESPLPPALRALPGVRPDAAEAAQSWDELLAAAEGSLFGPALRALPREPDTGLPSYAACADLLELRYEAALLDFLRTDYRGPDGAALTDAVRFRADLLNAGYLLRLRRFHTPPDKARALLLSDGGSLTRRAEDAVLAAPDDGSALTALLASPLGKRLRGLTAAEPERFVRRAEAVYFRSLLHSAPALSAVYAFLTLQEAECGMLQRVHAALLYGADPRDFVSL